MKINNLNLVIIALSMVFVVGCEKDNTEINTTEAFESFMIEEMSDQHIPAAAVLVFKGEAVLYENYFGLSNLESNRALMDNHMFLMASISKVITGIALLQLFDKGDFDLDDPINDYLPFTVVVPGYSIPITFRMLLTHTSGIADNDPLLDEQYYYSRDPDISLSYFIENYLSPEGEFYDNEENFYNFEPGTEYAYSNIGSALIGVLVENITGQDFNAYCKENIFSVLEMQSTSWRLDEINQPIVTPYDYINGQNQAIQHYTNADYPNGGLRSTVKDFHKLLAALANEGQFGDVQLLKQNTVKAIMTPQIPSVDTEVGLHFFLLDDKYNLWGHDGGEQGVATIMGFDPITKIGTIILTNQGEADLDEIFQSAVELGLNL